MPARWEHVRSEDLQMHVYTMTVELLPEEMAEVFACSTRGQESSETFRAHSVRIPCVRLLLFPAREVHMSKH
jgi:hypothetical protein